VERHGLLAGGPGLLEVTNTGGEVSPAADSRRQRPRAPERLSPHLQPACERPPAIALADGRQRLDLVREELDHTWFGEAEGSDCLGEAV
jgi:hypothetical protein